MRWPRSAVLWGWQLAAPGLGGHPRAYPWPVEGVEHPAVTENVGPGPPSPGTGLPEALGSIPRELAPDVTAPPARAARQPPVATARLQRPGTAAMRAAGRELPAAAAEEPGSDARGEQPPGKKCVYVEPPRRVKEILEEHVHFQKEECDVKHPAAVALEGVWDVRNNFSIRSLKAVSPNRSSLLLQPQFYSRHARIKTGKKCVYVEPPRRVKEIPEEHVHFQKEECDVKHPAAVALEGVWDVKNNFSIRSLKAVSPNRSSLLLQPQFYSRHARIKRKKCVYVEPPRRVKEIPEEHVHFQKEECDVKHPAAGNPPYQQRASVCQDKWLF
ncbi:uncharacterized protein C11orf97 homolog isoform X4 [Pseudopipra pipra]|uniref:uncharacterized protein C11orf97 homolog isoform X4 n=1 Tax=Pseudopipra pipra TaxID=415032 RepID=UPI00313A1249